MKSKTAEAAGNPSLIVEAMKATEARLASLLELARAESEGTEEVPTDRAAVEDLTDRVLQRAAGIESKLLSSVDALDRKTSEAQGQSIEVKQRLDEHIARSEESGQALAASITEASQKSQEATLALSKLVTEAIGAQSGIARAIEDLSAGLARARRPGRSSW